MVLQAGVVIIVSLQLIVILLSGKFSLLFIGHVTSIQVSFCYLAYCHCSFCINCYNLEEEKAFLLLNVYSFSAMLLKYTYVFRFQKPLLVETAVLSLCLLEARVMKVGQHLGTFWQR